MNMQLKGSTKVMRMDDDDPWISESMQNVNTKTVCECELM